MKTSRATYRRVKGSPYNRWHWESSCHKWPTRDLETSRDHNVTPLCSRCGDIERDRQSAQDSEGGAEAKLEVLEEKMDLVVDTLRTLIDEVRGGVIVFPDDKKNH